jgi:hypothetical protein
VVCSEVEAGNFTTLLYSVLTSVDKSVLKMMETLWKNSLITAKDVWIIYLNFNVTANTFSEKNGITSVQQPVCVTQYEKQMFCGFPQAFKVSSGYCVQIVRSSLLPDPYTPGVYVSLANRFDSGNNTVNRDNNKTIFLNKFPFSMHCFNHANHQFCEEKR